MVKVIEAIIHDCEDGQKVDSKRRELGHYNAIRDLGKTNVQLNKDTIFEAAFTTHGKYNSNSEVMETIRLVDNQKLYGLYLIK